MVKKGFDHCIPLKKIHYIPLLTVSVGNHANSLKSKPTILAPSCGLFLTSREEKYRVMYVLYKCDK